MNLKPIKLPDQPAPASPAPSAPTQPAPQMSQLFTSLTAAIKKYITTIAQTYKLSGKNTQEILTALTKIPSAKPILDKVTNLQSAFNSNSQLSKYFPTDVSVEGEGEGESQDDNAVYSQIKKLASEFIQDVKKILSELNQTTNNQELKTYIITLVPKLDSSVGSSLTESAAGKPQKDAGSMKLKANIPPSVKTSAKTTSKKETPATPATPATSEKPTEKPAAKKPEENVKLISTLRTFIQSVAKAVGVENINQENSALTNAISTSTSLSKDHQTKLIAFLQKIQTTFANISRKESGEDKPTTPPATSGPPATPPTEKGTPPKAAQSSVGFKRTY